MLLDWSLWSAVAEQPALRDQWLEEFAGFAVALAPEQTAEEWVVGAVKRWCYRPPVSVHLIDNHKKGPPDVLWGPGPLGRNARALARLVTLAYAPVA